MFLGVLAPSAPITNTNFAGVYYQAGIDQDASQIGQGMSELDNFYGSFIPVNGQTLDHHRINSLSYDSAYDYTYSDTYHPEQRWFSQRYFSELLDRSGR